MLWFKILFHHIFVLALVITKVTWKLLLCIFNQIWSFFIIIVIWCFFSDSFAFPITSEDFSITLWHDASPDSVESATPILTSLIVLTRVFSTPATPGLLIMLWTVIYLYYPITVVLISYFVAKSWLPCPIVSCD